MKIPSHRSTTSSRKPGVDIQGTVAVKHAPLVACPNCGGKTTAPGQGHRVRYVDAPCGHVHLVNCIGEVLVPCERCME
jgi:hypothetical protein